MLYIYIYIYISESGKPIFLSFLFLCFFFFFDRKTYFCVIHMMAEGGKLIFVYYIGENSQMPRFDKICGKLALFQKYLAMHHFFST